MPGNVLGTEDRAVKKTGEKFYLMELIFYLGKTDDKPPKWVNCMLKDGSYSGVEYRVGQK